MVRFKAEQHLLIVEVPERNTVRLRANSHHLQMRHLLDAYDTTLQHRACDHMFTCLMAQVPETNPIGSIHSHPLIGHYHVPYEHLIITVLGTECQPETLKLETVIAVPEPDIVLPQYHP
jgi:hypothetical protein